jgi:hypothetical protein
MVGSPSIVFSPRFISLTRPLKKHSDYHIIDRALDFLSSWNLFAPGANLSCRKMNISSAWTAAACCRFPAASLLARIRPGNADSPKEQGPYCPPFFPAEEERIV